MQLVRDFILARVRVEDCGATTPCWLWGNCTRDGYGRASLAGGTHQAHRVSYEAHVGPIPEGLEIDHLCCVTNCVNPYHLEAVTRDENLRRKALRRGHVIGGKPYVSRQRVGTTPRVRTHCINGHEYTPENVTMQADGRRCLTCQRRKWENRNRIKKEKRAANRSKTLGWGGVADRAATLGTQTHTRISCSHFRKHLS